MIDVVRVLIYMGAVRDPPTAAHHRSNDSARDRMYWLFNPNDPTSKPVCVMNPDNEACPPSVIAYFERNLRLIIPWGNWPEHWDEKEG